MPHRWSRRQLVQGAGAMGLGLLAGCGRLPWQAQPPLKSPRVGFAPLTIPLWLDALRDGLHELGYVEGQHLIIEARAVDGREEKIQEVVDELVRLPVDILVVTGNPTARAAKRATDTIPIVLGQAGVDPVAAGLVTSLARPGGNITGLSAITATLSGKRLELLKATIPRAQRVAALWHAAVPDKAVQLRETRSAAQALGIEVQSLEIRAPDDLPRVFAEATGEGADALLVFQDFLTLHLQPRIIELAAQAELPAMYENPAWIHDGGLMAYGPNVAAMFRRSATYVDRILKGAKPADLPIEQPMRFDLVINLRTAQALGLTIPHHVLLQATEVIH